MLYFGGSLLCWLTPAPYIGLLVDALYYLTYFPDVTHHPLEDRITERLLHKHALDADLGRELEEQHVRIARQGLDLLRDLEGAAREESISRELVAANIELYVERLRYNMVFEELVLFPAAAKYFDDTDWHTIAPDGDHTPPDPLFHSKVEERFEQLRKAIALESGSGDTGLSGTHA